MHFSALVFAVYLSMILSMRTILVGFLAWMLFVAVKEADGFTLIWRETSSTPIEKVESPNGFRISPFKAVKPLMDRSTRAPWAEFYLFVDATNYYFGNTRKGTMLTAPEPGHWVINGESGSIKGRAEKPAFKGMELYSWKPEGEEWHFSLLVGTNMQKTEDEIRKLDRTIVGAEDLRVHLAKLAEGEQVFWKNLAKEPIPEPLAKDLKSFCEGIQIKLDMGC